LYEQRDVGSGASSVRSRPRRGELCTAEEMLAGLGVAPVGTPTSSTFQSVFGFPVNGPSHIRVFEGGEPFRSAPPSLAAPVSSGTARQQSQRHSMTPAELSAARRPSLSQPQVQLQSQQRQQHEQQHEHASRAPASVAKRRHSDVHSARAVAARDSDHVHAVLSHLSEFVGITAAPRRSVPAATVVSPPRTAAGSQHVNGSGTAAGSAAPSSVEPRSDDPARFTLPPLSGSTRGAPLCYTCH
jgi:hypothetical protein